MFRRKVTKPIAVATLGPQRTEAVASVVIEGRSPEHVWAFIRPAESALLTNEDTLRAFTVPGTGPGVGEEQCFVTLVEGREQVGIIRVTAEEPAQYAEAFTTNGQVPQGSRWEIEAVAGGTRLTARSWTDLPAGLTAHWVAEQQERAQQAQDRYVRRVKVLLESGVTLPSTASGA